MYTDREGGRGGYAMYDAHVKEPLTHALTTVLRCIVYSVQTAWDQAFLHPNLPGAQHSLCA